MNIEAIEAGIGMPWAEVEEFLAGINAGRLSHKDIATALNDEGIARGWWAQSVTVAYEQQIGRRQPGQDCDGEFQTSVSKTVNGSMDEARNRWITLLGDAEEFSGVSISRGPDLSESDKWRYWRCGLADGSRVNVNIYQKAPGKAALSLQHERLESAEQLDHWRDFWKAKLAEFE
ncbi:hypothetical protein LWF01_01185 [Saxibacter everestensis]|uniref:DUF4287 domain-containing protein n=1 Tax=Saxibacter everestensis TaxID=2909229 RepID=A0ABY8QTV3_9MICO|nr:hypothetical protein LWF01_01185 [Brevibacteriaceae bacterium ZFBP1038]